MHDIRDERLHFIPEQEAPDPQTARLRELIGLLDQLLTEDYHAKRTAKRDQDRYYDRSEAA